MYSLKSTDERNNAIDILKILSMVMGFCYIYDNMVFIRQK